MCWGGGCGRRQDVDLGVFLELGGHREAVVLWKGKAFMRSIGDRDPHVALTIGMGDGGHSSEEGIDGVKEDGRVGKRGFHFNCTNTVGGSDTAVSV